MKKVVKQKASSTLPRGYVTFEHLKRRLLHDKKTREIYEATRFEHEIIVALIKKRLASGLSQAQVAKRAKMHQSAIARFETGETSPTFETASRILAAVGAKIKVSVS
jgi:ribosome-binding protein aMBF1 (putative translation factor)